MTITIKKTDVVLSTDLENKIHEQIEGLSKYYDNIILAAVEVGRESRHHQKGEIFRAEVNLEVPGKLLRAEAETDELAKSVREMYEKIKHELIKYKERQQA
jgi:ribosomal subunit interface protein